jgi:hypothetical protein
MRALWTVSLLLLLVAQACALGNTSPETSPRTDADSLQLIAEAVQRGEIDQDTATLYRVYAVKDGAKLPPAYRSTVPLRDGTPILRDAQARFGSLRPEIQEKLRPYLFPKGQP